MSRLLLTIVLTLGAGVQALAATGDWTAWGRDPGGTRFVPFEQINLENVRRLEVAWTHRTGGLGPDQATPLKVDDTLYLCTRDNVVIALDAYSGAERWRHDPGVPRDSVILRCRGVSYHRRAEADGHCRARIITATVDARLIALDAATGAPCADFSDGGTVDLRRGMGEDRAGFQTHRSPPIVVGDVVVVGASIFDNQYAGEPSGVIRGFDAVSGAFLWAWDLGRPGHHGEPPPGESYTRGTPNMWSLASADPALGLVYLPLGNATPDFYGAHRTPEMEEFTSSVVALNVADGSVRWHYRTVHHDIWDYDLPSQPVLTDFPTDRGLVPALILPTKRGEIFVLDRRSGAPLTEIEERPTPQTDVAGDFTAPTQPFSVGMPSVAGKTLREADMWGLTPLDQLYCRIRFRRARYEGPMTPPSLQGTVIYPGYIGGSNWGSASVDADRRILMVHSNHLANLVRLIPAKSSEAYPYYERYPDGKPVMPANVGAAQRGTPYAASFPPFLSFLGIPCQRPPYGTLTAIDLNSRRLLWSRPLGTARNSGPLGIASGLSLEMGTPASGGMLVTRSGLTFHGGTQDGYLRALATETGQEVWRRSLPVGAQATPISYLSADGSRQYVAIVAGGAPGTGEQGDYVVAYALSR